MSKPKSHGTLTIINRPAYNMPSAQPAPSNTHKGVHCPFGITPENFCRYGGIGNQQCVQKNCTKLHARWFSQMKNVCNFSIFGECTINNCKRKELKWADLIKGKTDPGSWQDIKTNKHHRTYRQNLGYNYRLGDAPQQPSKKESPVKAKAIVSQPTEVKVTKTQQEILEPQSAQRTATAPMKSTAVAETPAIIEDDNQLLYEFHLDKVDVHIDFNPIIDVKKQNVYICFRIGKDQVVSDGFNMEDFDDEDEIEMKEFDQLNLKIKRPVKKFPMNHKQSSIRGKIMDQTANVVFATKDEDGEYEDIGFGSFNLKLWIDDPNKESHEVNIHGDSLREQDYDKFADVYVKVRKLTGDSEQRKPKRKRAKKVPKAQKKEETPKQIVENPEEQKTAPVQQTKPVPSQVNPQQQKSKVQPVDDSEEMKESERVQQRQQAVEVPFEATNEQKRKSKRKKQQASIVTQGPPVQNHADPLAHAEQLNQLMKQLEDEINKSSPWEPLTRNHRKFRDNLDLESGILNKVQRNSLIQQMDDINKVVQRNKVDEVRMKIKPRQLVEQCRKYVVNATETDELLEFFVEFVDLVEGINNLRGAEQLAKELDKEIVAGKFFGPQTFSVFAITYRSSIGWNDQKPSDHTNALKCLTTWYKFVLRVQDEAELSRQVEYLTGIRKLLSEFLRGILLENCRQNLKDENTARLLRSLFTFDRSLQQGSSFGPPGDPSSSDDDGSDFSRGSNHNNNSDSSSGIDEYEGPNYYDENDWRSLRANPTLQELKSNAQPLLYPLEVSQPYHNLEEYLESHYRLLKEDFTCRLREGISNYKADNKKDAKLSVFFYDNVRVTGLFADEQFTGLQLRIARHFDKKTFRTWHSVNKFQYGQLLVFSDDKFRNRMFSGIIRKRDADEMDRTHKNFGYIIIYIELLPDSEAEYQLRNDRNVVDTFDELFDKDLVVVESKCYFEAYQYVLKSLQNRENFIPMQPKIIFADYHQNNRPSIWSVNAADNRYLEQPNSFQYALRQAATQYGLDEAQARAFQHVFDKSISIIQGPPGTGKTYVGEKIVDFMLKQIRRTGDDSLSTGPILVTCYTNHALDQFLEKLEGSSTKILRLGQRTKNVRFKEKYSEFAQGQLTGVRRPREYYHLKEDYEKRCEKFKTLNCDLTQMKNLPLLSQGMLEEADWADVEKELKRELRRIMTARAFDTQEINSWLQRDFSQVKLSLVEAFEDLAINFEQKVQEQLVRLRIDNTETGRRYLKFFDERIGKLSISPCLDWLNLLDLDLVHKEFVDEALRRREESDLDFCEIEYVYKDYIMDHEGIEDFIAQNAALFRLLETDYRNYDQKSDDDSRTKCTYDELFKKKVLEFGLRNASRDFYNIIVKLKNGRTGGPRSWPMRDRWALCITMTDILSRLKKRELQKEMREIDNIQTDMQDIDDETKARLMRKMDIVAMTTTYAARFKDKLNRLNAKIMIVEEAAEVFEAHIITSMNPNLEQLVLIGDHMQLRPMLQMPQFGEDYNLDVSLFERLIRSGFQSKQLDTQRRMRPIISKNIRVIYPQLLDHQWVQNMPNVLGVAGRKTCYFFSHVFQEEENTFLKSKQNPLEADLVINFSHYLIQQGYHPQQITILTLYGAQTLLIRNKIYERTRSDKEHALRKLRTVTVDNYQGEENDIVLISFVRCNPRYDIGFLSVQNRINVAISRAKIGLFMFGNKDTLWRGAEKHAQRVNFWQNQRRYNAQSQSRRREQSEKRINNLWQYMFQIVDGRGDLQSRLMLQCQNHGVTTTITHPRDFANVPLGGCMRGCDHELRCGHMCKLKCHNWDEEDGDCMEHRNQFEECKEDCNRWRPCGHPCIFQCKQCKDGKHDGHYMKCFRPVHKVLSTCNHIDHACHTIFGKRDEEIKCENVCNKSLVPCGHNCQQHCSADCKKIDNELKKLGFKTPCKQDIQKMLPCGHKAQVPCGQPVEAYARKKKCRTCGAGGQN